MTCPRPLLSALLCASALLPFGSAHAVSYFGYASADNFDAYNRLQDTDSGTTGAPAAYAVNVDGNEASAVTTAANGGSAYVFSRSVETYSAPAGFTISGGAGADAKVSYQVMLSGPATLNVVPVHVVAHGYVNGAASTRASSSFVVNYDNGGSLASLIAGVNLYGASGNTFTFDQVANFKVNAVYDVYLAVDTSSGGPGSGAAWSEAFVDPSFTIDDPALAALYHFEGIPAVPEPATWALAMAGLGVVLGVRRRRAPLPCVS
jgi:hypothetical protein